VSSPAASLPAPFVAVGERLRRTKELVLSVRSAYVLAALVVAQWLSLLALALTVRHNGWLYYAGGDQLWHYSGAYLLAHGHLPPTFVGYGWSIFLLPLAWLAGPNLVSALPGIVLVNTLIFLPIALLCVYGIASRIAGRIFGYFAAALWIALPYLGILFVEPGYHQKYTELTLPQLLGLSSVPDFPATVALLVAAYLCLRATETTGWHAAAAAGLACGYSLAIKPSNAIFLFAPAILLLVSRWSALPVFALGLAPALLTLALWKYRGLGQFAAAPVEPIRLAGGPADLLHRIYSPKLGSWEHLREVLDSLREHFWIARVLEWLPVAGCIGLLARSRRGFLLIGTWFTAFLLVKGTYFAASVEDASFFRLMMPAFPAYALLAAATVLLVPGMRARPERRSSFLSGRRLTVAVSAAAAVFAVLPLGIIAATPALHDQGSKAVREGASLIPVSPKLLPAATVSGTSVGLEWKGDPSRSAAVFYRILRSNATGGSGGVSCAHTVPNASHDCRLFMDAVGATRVTTYVDRPGRGTWTYRIGASANWLDDYAYGDVYVTSPPTTVTVP
jgi:hypothetical protein